MGLYKIDNASREEWDIRERRRHERRQWMVTLGEIALMVGSVVAVALLMKWLEI